MIRDAIESALSTLNQLNSSATPFDLTIDRGPDERLVRIDWRGATAAVMLGKMVRLRFRFTFSNGYYLEGDSGMAFNLSDMGMAVATLRAVDAKGFPAVVESVVWASSDPTVFTVTASIGDPAVADIIATGEPGSAAQLQVSADADLGAGVETLTGTADIAIVGGKAVAISIGLASV